MFGISSGGEHKASGCILAAGLAFPGSADRPTFTGKLFVPVPGKLQMENVVFSVRDLSGKNGKGLPYQADGWDLSWGAHDLV